jgi:hypothetical protein
MSLQCLGSKCSAWQQKGIDAYAVADQKLTSRVQHAHQLGESCHRLGQELECFQARDSVKGPVRKWQCRGILPDKANAHPLVLCLALSDGQHAPREVKTHDVPLEIQLAQQAERQPACAGGHIEH